jgi:asparagine synthase (glutamine-hydrolysing)
MANFLVIVDPDRDRRTAFCKAAHPQLGFLANLTLGECACGDFHAMWASGPRAPVAAASDGQMAAVIWGRPITGEGRPIDARDLAAAWSGLKDPLPIFDGYYAAAHYRAQTGLTVGADLIGMFPVFWWHDGDVLLVGSSPELFKLHPLFRFELDLAGLTGILLMMHCVDDRTLMKGVKRLGAGKALLWRSGSAPREVVQYELPVSAAHVGLPFSAAVERVNDAFNRSVARHVPADGACGLTLSGGRDSRLLAGTMVGLGRSPVALTFGDRDDIEMQCATEVARALHLDHRASDMSLEGYDVFAELHAQWLHCSTGFNCIEYWNCLKGLETLPPFFAAAFIMDSVVGGSHVDWAYSDTTRGTCFANLFARVNAYGIKVESLRQLLRPEVFGTHVEDVIRRLNEIYDGYSGHDAQRTWCFDLLHRQRFYTATLPWQFCFASWPILPSVDREVLGVVGGMELGMMSERLVEDAIIRRHFPALAELPLDRNAYDTTPLEPRLRRRIADSLSFQMRPLTRMLSRRQDREVERHIYYRVFDFNGPGWKAARRQAEPHRRKLYDLFDKEALDAILPPPDAVVKVQDAILDFSGKKLLVGLCLWAARYL